MLKEPEWSKHIDLPIDQYPVENFAEKTIENDKIY